MSKMGVLWQARQRSDDQTAAVLYFAYGSHMDVEHLRSRAPRSRVIGQAVLENHRLAFTRLSRHGGGVADVRESFGVSVVGVLVCVHDDEVDELERKEGHCLVPPAYRRKTVLVRLIDPEPNQEPELEVTTYVVAERVDHDVVPKAAYLDRMMIALAETRKVTAVRRSRTACPSRGSALRSSDMAILMGRCSPVRCTAVLV